MRTTMTPNNSSELPHTIKQFHDEHPEAAGTGKNTDLAGAY